MTPEARHIKITNGLARSYLNNKVDYMLKLPKCAKSFCVSL